MTGKIQEQIVDVKSPEYPTLSFEDLLQRAQQKYKQIVIAIDDLEKQDPARLRELLLDAQGMLKGNASFILTGHPTGLSRELLTREIGLFDLPLELPKLDIDTMQEMLINYLNSARSHEHQLRDPKAFLPFTPETANRLCQLADGSPRQLNRLGNFILINALALQATSIDSKIMEQGLIYAAKKLRTGLTANDLYVLELVRSKGTLSDENVGQEELNKLNSDTFNELLPILEKLTQKDLISRLPTEEEMAYQPNYLFLEKESFIPIDND